MIFLVFEVEVLGIEVFLLYFARQDVILGFGWLLFDWFGNNWFSDWLGNWLAVHDTFLCLLLNLLLGRSFDSVLFDFILLLHELPLIFFSIANAFVRVERILFD